MGNQTMDQPMDRKQAAVSFVWTVLFSIVGKLILPLAGIILVSRKIGPAEIGTYGIIAQVIMFSEVFRDAGLLQCYVSEGQTDEDLDASYFLLTLVFALVPAVAIFGIAQWMGAMFNDPRIATMMPITSVAVAINGLCTMGRAKLLRSGQIKLMGQIELAASILGLGVAIILVQCGLGFEALIWQLIVSSIIAAAIILAKHPIRWRRPQNDTTNRILKKSSSLLGANLLNNIFLLSDPLVVAKLVGVREAGFLSVGRNLATKPADLLLFPMTRTLMVVLGQSANDLPRLRELTGRAFVAALLVIMPVYALLGALATPLVDVLYGEEFHGAGPALALLCLFMSLRVIGNVAGTVLVAFGKHANTIWLWIGAILVTGSLIYFKPEGSNWLYIVSAYIVGATVAYVGAFVLVIREAPFSRAIVMRCFTALAALGVTAGFCYLVTLLPVPAIFTVLIGGVFAPVLHLTLLGTILARSPFEYLSPSGLRKLYREL